MKLKDLWQKSGLVLCTRWHHKASLHPNPKIVNVLHRTVSALPMRMRLPLKELNGFVLTNSNTNFKPWSMSEDTKFAQYYYEPQKRVHIYLPPGTDRGDLGAHEKTLADTIRKAIFTVIDQTDGYSKSPVWKDLNYETKEGRLGYFGKKQAWLPEGQLNYELSKEWIDSANCFMDWKCRKEMKKHHPKMHKYFVAAIGVVDDSAEDEMIKVINAARKTFEYKKPVKKKEKPKKIFDKATGRMIEVTPPKPKLKYNGSLPVELLIEENGAGKAIVPKKEILEWQHKLRQNELYRERVLYEENGPGKAIDLPKVSEDIYDQI